MAEEFVLESVEETVVGSNGGGVSCWAMTFLKPDGSKHLHVMPKVALNWRMAEYELSIDEALDMLLHEVHAHDPLVHRREQDPAMARGLALRTPLGQPDEPVTLWTAPSIEEARKAQQIRIEHAKQTKRRVVTHRMRASSAKEAEKIADPLDVVRTTHVVTPEDVQEKRMVVRWYRQLRGLDADLPCTVEVRRGQWVQKPLQLDAAAVRREIERRKDPEDELYGRELPKELTDASGGLAGHVRQALDRDEGNA